MLRVSAASSALVAKIRASAGNAGRLMSIDSAVSPVSAPSRKIKPREPGCNISPVDAGGVPELQLLDPGPGAILVFLRGAAADAAGANDLAFAEDRHRALAHDHFATRCGGDAARGRLVGACGHIAAGAAERRRGDRLALAA